MPTMSHATQPRGRTHDLHNCLLHAQGLVHRGYEPCSGWSVVHDLAALSEGNLSRRGKRRLAKHLARCRACRAIVASLVDTEAERTTSGQVLGDSIRWIEDAAAPGWSAAPAQSAKEPLVTAGPFRERDPAPPQSAERERVARSAASQRAAPATCYLHLDHLEPLGWPGPHAILVVAANPGGTTPAALDLDCTEIRRELDATPGRAAFGVESRWATTVDELRRHLVELNPAIVHFSGHGGSGGVTLCDERGQPGPVSPRTLAAVIAASRRTCMVTFNACHSTRQADALRGNVNCVIGIPDEISAHDARAFALSFYRGLGHRRSTSDALEHAVADLNARLASDMHLPVCRTRNGDSATQLILPELDSRSCATISLHGFRTGASRRDQRWPQPASRVA